MSVPLTPVTVATAQNPGFRRAQPSFRPTERLVMNIASARTTAGVRE